METSRRLPPPEVWRESSVFKVLLRSNCQYLFFLYFRVKYDCLTYFSKFQPITTIRNIFFREVAVAISLSRSNYSLVGN